MKPDPSRALRVFIGIILAWLVLAFSAKADPGAISIVFIGDSITHGAGTPQPATQAAPVVCGQLLQQQLPGTTVAVFNQGYVGFTALGISKHMPGIEKEVATFFAAHPGRPVFSIMLGTNDSANSGPAGCPTAAADYRNYLKAIVDEILAKYPDAQKGR